MDKKNEKRTPEASALFREAAKQTVSGKRLAKEVRNTEKRLEKRLLTCGEGAEDRNSRWFTENFHLLRLAAAGAASAFGHTKRLPTLKNGNARLQEWAEQLTERYGAALGRREIEADLRASGVGALLTERELYLLKAALEAALLRRLAETPEAAEAVITSLYRLKETDFSVLQEAQSPLHRLLCRDAVYAAMDPESRRDYRRRIAALAAKNGHPEPEQAELLLQQGKEGQRHFGSFLYERRLSRSVYYCACLLPPLCFGLLFLLRSGNALCTLLLLLPFSEAWKYLTDTVLGRLLRPTRLPRLDYTAGIPEESRTLAVSVVLLQDPAQAQAAAKQLERGRLANRAAGKNLLFGLLADLPEHRERRAAEDVACLKAAAGEIRRLNERYGGGFFLLCRERSYSERDRVWRGWERKRGAVISLLRLLRQREGNLTCTEGDGAALRNVRYLLVLDADTELCPETAAELAGILAHPLQRARVSGGVVTEGCGLLQPRISVRVEEAERSAFSRIASGGGGLDPYGSVNSEFYQDAFGEGSFTGKGLMDVDAALACLEGSFQEERLLSHDLIEGAYLGCAYAGDVELSEGFPAGVLPYYKRLHRWVRGDVQTLPWLGRFVRNERGERVRNPVRSLTKWRIADNLRRALLQPLLLLFLFLYGLSASPVWGSAAALSLLCLGLRLLCSTLCSAGRRHRGEYPTPAGAELLRLCYLLILLPYAAFVQLSAMLMALYRLYISHRKLLQWTPAADSGGEEGSYYRKLSVGPAAGALALCSGLPPFMALGLLWLFSPLMAKGLSRERQRRPRIGLEERVFLQQSAGDIWGYFRKTLTAERNWLPPDNVSELPTQRVAERTSPTNIGMSLLSAAAALDLKLCSPSDALALIERQLTTVERLPRFRGQLYNWYDIRTLQVLDPPVISTVDSGNLIAALIALKSALRERGEEALARRAEALADSLPLDFLYDREQKLFRIGWSGKTDTPVGGCYDLLESEARLTSYIAIARGEAERKHWRRLGRALWHHGGRSGMVSWTGTMFEYFLPELFLPEYRGSLLSDSLRSCRREQQRCRYGGVWGKSESACGETEADLSYRYRAHGVQTLALKRGMDRQRVIAPYASFLSLRCGVSSAVRNLLRLRALGAEGRFGFYDAVDFSAETPEIVRTFMVHHLGMSLLAIDNALKGDIMCRRFLKDPAMEAYTGLLQERSFSGERIRKIPAVPESYPAAETGWRRNRLGYDAARPACCLLSNGSYTVLLSETGASVSQSGGCSLAAGGLHSEDGRQGILFFAADEAGQLLSLQPAPGYDEELRWSSTYDGSSESLFAEGGGLSVRRTIRLPEALPGERRELQLRNHGSRERTLRLVLYFEPALASQEQFSAHPAFSRLCLQSSLRDGCLTVRRRPGGKLPERALAVSCSLPCRWETDRDSLFGRGGLRALRQAVGRPGKGVCDSENPCVYGELTLQLQPGETRTVVYDLALAGDTDAALETLRQMRERFGENRKFPQLMRRLRVDREAAERSFALLTELCRADRRPLTDRSALWRWGISGDLPLCTAELRTAEPMLQTHALLSGLGFQYDLAVFVNDEGVYGRPELERLRGLAEKYGAAERLGKRGGIHAVGGDAAAQAAVRAAAGTEPSFRGETAAAARREAWFLPPTAETRALHQTEFLENAVRFRTERGVGVRAWSHILTNGHLSWLATDAGTGNLWLDNAREYPVTPWENDPLSLRGGERLTLLRNGTAYSLFADADEYPTETEFGFGWAQWRRSFGGTQTTVRALIPEDANGLVLIVDIEAAGKDDRLCCSFRLTGKVPELGLYASEEPLCMEECETSIRAEFRAAERLYLVLGEEKAAAYASESALRALAETKRHWACETGGCLRVNTPSEPLNRYLNGWAVYQTLACRLLGRCSLYQSGGAFGFRDQLQDACALGAFYPERLKEQILRSAAHQYEEGDVMHWWHPLREGDRGVRTRCSDDLLWLPYAVSVYIEVGGDEGIWETVIPFLHSEPLSETEADRYEEAKPGESGTLREHCARAVRELLRRGCGPHGLLRMGSGDWNDGFDRVRGESEWLTWFGALVLERFGLHDEAARLGAAADAAWQDGQYLRGYYEDGTPLGAPGSAECEIDSLAQSFAVLSGFGDPERARQAVKKAAEQLTDRKNGLIRLFAPPFDGAEEPGYIRSYLPGVRENGGQYTHAAVWLAAACLRCGETETGAELLETLLPETHPEAVYQAEPYVLAADVYSNPDMEGRAGWSWYTGAAGWYLRTAVEELLGLRLRRGVLSVEPHLPRTWQGFSAEFCGTSVRAERGADGKLAVNCGKDRFKLFDI